jgi:hypothetical protein
MNTLKQEIIDILIKEGLDEAEALAVAAVRAAFRLIVLLVPKVSNGLGVIIGPMIALVEPKVLALLDHIDGEDDQGY